MVTILWDREDIEATPFSLRPQARCRIQCDYIDEDGLAERRVKYVMARISVDGNNPWLEIYAAGCHHAERFSWRLVLEVVNDKYATPIEFTKVFEYYY